MSNPIFDWMEEIGITAVKMDGFDDAVLGYAKVGDDYVLIYPYEALVNVLAAGPDMSREDAEEYVDFNVVRGVEYVTTLEGLPAPIILYGANEVPGGRLLKDIFAEMFALEESD
jgi:hypothetical protein